MPRQRVWALIGLSGAVVALLLLASSLSELRFQPGHFYDLNLSMPTIGGADAGLPRDPASLAFWQTLISSVSVVLLLLLVIGLIFSRRVRRELLRRLITILIVLVVFNQLLKILRSNP